MRKGNQLGQAPYFDRPKKSPARPRDSPTWHQPMPTSFGHGQAGPTAQPHSLCLRDRLGYLSCGVEVSGASSPRTRQPEFVTILY
jgi:hypothetical protein